MSSNKVFGALMWKLLERIAVQGINLIVQIVLARVLLPVDFGNLAIIVAIINYAAIFVQSGVSTVIIQRKDITDIDISTLLLSSLFFALILYIGLFFAAPFISNLYGTEDLIWPLRILSLLLFFNSVNAIQVGIYSRKMDFKKIFIRSLVAVLVSGLVGIMMALNGFGLWALVAHNLINMAMIVLSMSFDKKLWFKLKFSFCSFKKLYVFTGKIIATSIITGGSDLLRALVIGKKYSADDLAYYDKAYTFSNYSMQIIGQSVTSVVLPSLSKKQEDKQRLKDLTRQSIRLSAFIVFPILMGVAAVAESFVVIVLTEKWLNCVPYLMLFCVLRMPSFISSIDKQVYYALGKSEINLYYEIGFLILNTITLFICMQFGILYIAIGVMVIEWIGCVSLFFVSRGAIDYTLIERISDLWRPLLNSTVMFIVTYFVGRLFDLHLLRFVVQIVTGLSVYTLLCFVTKDNNIKEIKNIIKRRYAKND